MGAGGSGRGGGYLQPEDYGDDTSDDEKKADDNDETDVLQPPPLLNDAPSVGMASAMLCR